jgi:hypothetical protein
MKWIMLLGLIILGVLAIDAFGVGAEGQMVNCPLSNRWVIATWTGPDNTPIDAALGTCGEAAVIAAYWLNPETQGWDRYLAGRPDITTLTELDNSQGILALGSATAPATPIPVVTPGPKPTPVAEQPIVFTGSGSKDTGDFDIAGSEFTISWTIESDSPEFVVFAFFVLPAGETAGSVADVTFHDVGSDSTVVHAGPGSFWLHILSGNCTWRIEVKS